MSKGFLILAQNGKHDYVRMAYALTLSLWNSQKKINNVSIIVNKNEKIYPYGDVFDKIIEMDDPKTDWKVDNKWCYYQVTPYDETIVLDADMLFFHDISLWWKFLSENYDITFTTTVKNYRSEDKNIMKYREVFVNNNLPNIYTTMFYFKKTKKVERYFKYLKIMFENWEYFYNDLLRNPPNYLSGDLLYSMATKILLDNEWNNDILSFVHMRTKLQDEFMQKQWNNELFTFFTEYENNIELKVNNFNQVYPFHYIKKDFLTEEIIKQYEEKVLCIL